jgi:uncharacterized membrane protein YhaH (DUF805 family)
MLGFRGALMDWLFLYNSFEGRIGRQTFWIAVVVLTVIEFAAHFAAEQLQGDRLSAIVDLAFVYPEFAVALKRAHDRDMPILFLVVFFAASAVLDLLTVLQMTGSDDQPTMISVLIAVPFTILALFLLVELGFRRGTTGPNQYGPDPLAKI